MRGQKTPPQANADTGRGAEEKIGTRSGLETNEEDKNIQDGRPNEFTDFRGYAKLKRKLREDALRSLYSITSPRTGSPDR